MEDLLAVLGSKELYVIYGLVFVMILLIVMIIVVDHKARASQRELGYERPKRRRFFSFDDDDEDEEYEEDETEDESESSSEQYPRRKMLPQVVIEKEEEEEEVVPTVIPPKALPFRRSEENDVVRESSISPKSKGMRRSSVVMDEEEEEDVLPQKKELSDLKTEKEDVVVFSRKDEMEMPSRRSVSSSKARFPKPVSDDEEAVDINVKKEEGIVYAEEDQLSQTKAQLELQRLTEELAKAQEEKEKDISHTDFEREQEENAIISYRELLQKGEDIYHQNEQYQKEVEKNEPISLEQLQVHFQEEELPEVELNNFVSSVVDHKPKQKETRMDTNTYSSPSSTFKSTPFVSPIYGLQDDVPVRVKREEKIELEQTADLAKFDEEIKKTNEFLAMLKELQKKLD